jgi:hypothetical protein
MRGEGAFCVLIHQCARPHAHGDTHAAADAQGGQALVETSTRAPEAPIGWPGDRAAVDVDLGDIPAEVLVDRACLGDKSLVGLDQLEIACRPAGLF